MEQMPVNLFDLPEEIIEEIIAYLDFMDLKIVSQSCHYLYELSGKRLVQLSKIRLTEMMYLTNADLNTFKNSRRMYENVSCHVYGGIKNFENILKQVKLLPSVNMLWIDLSVALKPETEEILKEHAPKLKEICAYYCINPMEGFSISTINIIKSIFNKYKIDFNLQILYTLNEIDFREINEACNYPSKLVLDNERFKLDHTIESVRRLMYYCMENYNNVLFFKKVNRILISHALDNSNVLKAAVFNNKETLRDLELNEWRGLEADFELPCQLRSFSFSNIKYSPLKLLSSQKNLRDLRLERTELTNELLDILSKQKCLSKLSLSSCYLHYSLDMEKFGFLKNVMEIYFEDLNMKYFTILEAILNNADKVYRLTLRSYMKAVPNEFIKKNLMPNLRILKVEKVKMCEYVLPRIEAPNLEVCVVDCIPYHLFTCEYLKNLQIRAKISPKELENILRRISSLEVFHFKIDVKHLEDSLHCILHNLNNILHFEMSCELTGYLNLPTYKKIMETKLNHLEIPYSLVNYPEEDEEDYKQFFYRTDNFSFKVILYCKNDLDFFK